MTKIKTTKEMNVQATKAVMSIVLFVLTYLIILILVVALTYLATHYGLQMIKARANAGTLLLGIGMVSLFVLILYFLIKFMFSTKKSDLSGLREISRKDEPVLFELIDEVVQKVNTKFPKKVYLTGEVNAFVFYDSSFWSMLFPTQKNLAIGVGLINSVTKTELKAIVSHEFGHFSQRAMKVGSFVYNAERVIYNMLFDNESFGKTYETWANAHLVFSLFAAIGRHFINGVIKVMISVYNLLKLNHYSLAREMEFQADEIAASVTGIEPVVSSLLRIDLATVAYNTAIQFYAQRSNESAISENIYKEQTYLTNFIALKYKLKFEGQWPLITIEHLNKYNLSKLVIKDQWASHPSVEDRVARLAASHYRAHEMSFAPASDYLSDITKWQEEFTKQIFSYNQNIGEFNRYSIEDFKVKFEEEYKLNKLPEIYNGYYDSKDSPDLDIEKVQSSDALVSDKLLFSDEMIEQVNECIAIKADLMLLEQIRDGGIQLRTFEYDGNRYNKVDARRLIVQLNKEMAALSEKIKRNDVKTYQTALNLEKRHDQAVLLKTYYKDWIDIDKEFIKAIEIDVEMNNAFAFINRYKKIINIVESFSEAKSTEAKFKSAIQTLLNDHKYAPYMTNEFKESLELYLSKDWEYFSGNSYLNDNLNVLWTAKNNFLLLISEAKNKSKRQVLDVQAKLFENAVI